MNWSSDDLERQWKSFVQHVNFTFSGTPEKEIGGRKMCIPNDMG